MLGQWKFLTLKPCDELSHRTTVYHQRGKQEGLGRPQPVANHALHQDLQRQHHLPQPMDLENSPDFEEENVGESVPGLGLASKAELALRTHWSMGRRQRSGPKLAAK